jgi:hypothetical protein
VHFKRKKILNKLMIFDVYLRQTVALALHHKAGMIDRFKVPRVTDLRDLQTDVKKHIDERF